MDDEQLIGLTGIPRAAEGLNGKLAVDCFAGRPADHATAEQVDEGAQIQPSLIGRNVGEVGYPGFVRQRDPKILLQQIREYCRLGIDDRCLCAPAPTQDEAL